MSVNLELELLTAVIDEGNIRPLMDQGIDVSNFKTNDGIILYKFILHYYKKRETSGKIPTREQIVRGLPRVFLPDPSRSTVEELLSEFQHHCLKDELRILADHILDYLDEPETVLDNVSQKCTELSRSYSKVDDFVLSESCERLIQQYEINKDPSCLNGIPYPWEALNEETRGLLNGQFVILYGRPKSKKSWLLFYMAAYAYYYGNKDVLIISKELTLDQVLQRIICILCELPYEKFLKGELDQMQAPEGGTLEERFYEIVHNIKEDENYCSLTYGSNKRLIITMASNNRRHRINGMTGVRQKIEDYKPEVVFLDAMYKMPSERSSKQGLMDWKVQSEIVQGLKDTALDYKLPIVGTSQANRDSEGKLAQTLKGLAFADAYGMECDLAMECIPFTKDDKPMVIMGIPGAREIHLAGFLINGRPATDFSGVQIVKRDASGMTLKDEDGSNLMVPLSFKEHYEMENYFKDMNDPTKIITPNVRAHEVQTMMARVKKDR